MKHIPIVVAYKKKYGKKVCIKVFTDQRNPDRILSSRSKLLPKDCEILDVGVGSKFYEKYNNKYKI